MAPKGSEVAGKHKGLLITAIIASLVAAALAIAVTRPAESQSTTSFDYTLPVNPYELNDIQLTTVLDRAKGAGVKSVSSGAVWWYMNEGQPSIRSYNWTGLDRLVSAAEARGMKVSLQLHGTPDWVHPDLKNTVPDHSDRIWYPPVRNSTELNHWSDFVGDVVSRYKGRVDQYEMWNEPNLSEFWKPSPKPNEYAALLRAGYFSAKSADPNASVVFGGLSRNDVGYLNAYYSEAKKYSDATSNKYFFDVLGVHPYSSVHPPTADKPEERCLPPGSPISSSLEEPCSPDRNFSRAVSNGPYGEIDQNFLGIKKMKSAMDAQEGDTGKSIFLGEYGFSTTDTWMKAIPDWRRALYLKRAYMLARDLPYIKGMSWYYYHPDPSTTTAWTLLDDYLNERMSFRALKQVTGAESGGATVTLSMSSTCSLSGTYRISPTTTNLDTPANWELYVDGVPQGTTYSEVPIDWDTTKVADGTHTLMVAAYPQAGSQAGSVWPSNVVSVRVNNSSEPVTAESLSTDASNYTGGSTATAEATLCSRESITLEQLVIAVRLKSTNENFDFPLINNYSLGTTPQTVTSTRTFSKPGEPTRIGWRTTRAEPGTT